MARVGPRLHPGGHRFGPGLHVFSLCRGLPDLAHPVHFGNSFRPQTYSAPGGLFELWCQGSPPLLGTLSLPDSPSPIVSVEGRGGAAGKEVSVGCSAPSLPPALRRATLQALSPRARGASKAAGGWSFVRSGGKGRALGINLFKAPQNRQHKTKSKTKTKQRSFRMG